MLEAERSAEVTHNHPEGIKGAQATVLVILMARHGSDDDFKANSLNVRPVDKIVYNDYECMGEKNAHKSYGYLRKAEMAQIIADFLGKTHYNPFSWIKKYWSNDGKTRNAHENCQD